MSTASPRVRRGRVWRGHHLDVDDVWAGLVAQRGFLARKDLLALGFDDRYIRRQLRGRLWTRVRNGAYLPTEIWLALDAVARHRVLCRAVLFAHGDAVVLSHVSAVLLDPAAAIWNIRLDRVHVLRRDGRSGSIERDVVHHEGTVNDAEIMELDGLLSLPLHRALVSTIAREAMEPGLVLTDSILHGGGVEKPQLDEENDRRVRSHGHRTSDMVLRLADARAESPGETRSRFMFWSHGFPKPEVQYPVYDRSGRLVGITDLAWPLHRLLYEYDGRVKYGRLLKPGQEPGDVVFAEKKREDLLRSITQFSMERATWADLGRPVETCRRTRGRMTRIS